jgi:hypothetical protein
MGFSVTCAEIILGNPAHMSGANGTITRIVLHGTVSACSLQGARNNAYYFQTSGAGGLAHAVADPAEIIGCCDEDVACWHAPPNHGSVGLEFCDPQGVTDIQANADDPNRWQDLPHQQMLHKGALWVQDVAARHSVPLVRVGAAELLAAPADQPVGICGHDDVVAAWHQSDHTDPDAGGGFPWDQFMGYVLGTIPPPQQHPVEDDMTFIAEFLDWPSKLWLVTAEPTASGNPDMANSAGTRKWINNPDRFWELAKLGVRVLSGPQTGGHQFKEVV